MCGRFRLAKNFVIIGVFILSFQCLGLSDETKDKEYSQEIVGTWKEDSTSFCYGYSVFYKGGAYEAKMYVKIFGDVPIMYAKGGWWIKGGKLYNTIYFVKSPIMPLPKAPIVDVIVDISDSVMTLIDDQGQKYQKFRVK